MSISSLTTTASGLWNLRARVVETLVSANQDRTVAEKWGSLGQEARKEHLERKKGLPARGGILDEKV